MQHSKTQLYMGIVHMKSHTVVTYHWQIQGCFGDCTTAPHVSENLNLWLKGQSSPLDPGAAPRAKLILAGSASVTYHYVYSILENKCIVFKSVSGSYGLI